MKNVYSVTQITTYLKTLVSRDVQLKSLTVKGELSNVKYNHSGIIFCTLKDDKAALSVVMFSSDAYALDFTLEDGMQVEITGSIGFYEKGGSCQIYAKKIVRAGQGELYERFLALKNELDDMGMFADIYKKPIPAYIKRLGIVTAPTGAAVRDIINITRRRNPFVEMILYPAKVQGEGAAESVAKGIEVLDRAGVDVMIVGRGGGSIEDLWAFNERVVAEAIFNSETPVISAVGHQTDVTIADFVSDCRAPTPSAAAELAVYEYDDFADRLEAYAAELSDAVTSRIGEIRLELKEYEGLLRKKRPDMIINDQKMRLADAENLMRNRMREILIRYRLRADRAGSNLPSLMEKRLKQAHYEVGIKAEQLKRVSPLEKLAMGYSYVCDQNGKNVREASGLSVGDEISILMHHGRVRADVTEVTEENEYRRKL